MEAKRIAPQTAETVTGFLKPLMATGSIPKTEAQTVRTLLLDATNPFSQGPDKAKTKLITTAQAAERLGVCKKTVLRMAQQGNLTKVYPRPSNKALRFKESEIDAIIEGGVE